MFWIGEGYAVKEEISRHCGAAPLRQWVAADYLSTVNKMFIVSLGTLRWAKNERVMAFGDFPPTRYAQVVVRALGHQNLCACL